MTDSEKVLAYIDKHDHWLDEINHLRQALLRSELKEEIKWGAPSYSLNGKILIGIGAFKNHLGFWFHQGVFLKDTDKKLINAQEGKTKALRQWRIEKGDLIDPKVVTKYIQETIDNCRAGKEVKPQRRKEFSIPPILQDALKKDHTLSDAYKKLSPSKQREYAEYITEAKRDATKESRLGKIAPMIKEGKGWHDKYKNC